MSVNLRNYQLALANLDHVIRAVPRERWANSSPCEGWTAAHVAGHAMAVTHNVGARLRGVAPLDPFTDPAAVAGDDPLAHWRRIRDDTLAALDTPGTLARTTEFGGRSLTVDQLLGAVIADPLVHAWDIARATGGDEVLEPSLVPIAHAALAARGEELLRAPNRYAAAVAPSAADAQSALLAFAGRRP